MIGFTSYNVIEIVPQPTTAELVAALTAEQRIAILNGFIQKIIPSRMKQVAPKSTVIHLYARIDAIEEYCRKLARGEIVITPAVIDSETGEITTPAVYQSVPTSVTGLKSEVNNMFSSEFTAVQSGAIVDAMIKWSHSEGTGTAAYYLSKIME